MDQISETSMIVGIIIATAIWGYAMFSNHPDIVKNRNTTQKFMNTFVWLTFLFWWIGMGAN